MRIILRMQLRKFRYRRRNSLRMDVCDKKFASDCECDGLVHSAEDAIGGLKKEGGGQRHEGHDSPKRGFGPPPPFIWDVFYPRVVSLLCFSCSENPRQRRPEASFFLGGVQKFSGGCVLWCNVLPSYVLQALVSWAADVQSLLVRSQVVCRFILTCVRDAAFPPPGDQKPPFLHSFSSTEAKIPQPLLLDKN